MESLEIARKLAELKQVNDAQRAYMLVLNENANGDPLVDFEAAAYILLTGGDSKVAMTPLVLLYNKGAFQEEILGLLTKQVYLPSVSKRQSQYDENVKRLSKYKYLFRKDFENFVDLKIKFFPFGKGFLPFYPEENRFGKYVDFNYKVIDRNFFGDLENPIFQPDVYSQYQLEYLYDNVRKSEWVAKDNHIYIHYTNWQVFCAYLQVLDFRKLLKDEKFIFLMEEEENLYPIDFVKEFDIDYSNYPKKPIGVEEVKRLIWHAQLSAHNGGDFFNEIFDSHPNLLTTPSILLTDIETIILDIKKQCKKKTKRMEITFDEDAYIFSLEKYLKPIKNVTEKDVLVALTLCVARELKNLDEDARIAPALFLQPHFHNIYYEILFDENRHSTLHSEEFKKLKSQPVFKQFKYIKTFAPMRRPTTSYAATIRFKTDRQKQKEASVMDNTIATVILNCSYRIDRSEPLYQDSRLVRFEDAKLNPKAVFTALAVFLDIPYTESMAYCSLYGKTDPKGLGEVIGFDTSSVYKTYDEFAGKNERVLIEYLMRDAYEKYGYDFQYYDGNKIPVEELTKMVENLEILYSLIKQSYFKALPYIETEDEITEEQLEVMINQHLKEVIELIKKVALTLSENLYFINSEGQPLQMMEMIELDEKLLENPIYR